MAALVSVKILTIIRKFQNGLNCLPAGVFAVAIALGQYHSCAIVSGGGVKCWGANFYGQLGIGSITDATSPADVEGDGSNPLFSTLFFIPSFLHPVMYSAIS